MTWPGGYSWFASSSHIMTKFERYESSTQHCNQYRRDLFDNLAITNHNINNMNMK